jgi:hypothetical protein
MYRWFSTQKNTGGKMKPFLIEYYDSDEKTHFIEINMTEKDELLASFLVKKRNKRFSKIKTIKEVMQ